MQSKGPTSFVEGHEKLPKEVLPAQEVERDGKLLRKDHGKQEPCRSDLCRDAMAISQNAPANPFQRQSLSPHQRDPKILQDFCAKHRVGCARVDQRFDGEGPTRDDGERDIDNRKILVPFPQIRKGQHTEVTITRT